MRYFYHISMRVQSIEIKGMKAIMIRLMHTSITLHLVCRGWKDMECGSQRCIIYNASNEFEFIIFLELFYLIICAYTYVRVCTKFELFEIMV
jgi:hypothetical protein